jgi:pyruvate/2-oxoglutarate dehydrogenase complex dihydrolipoamide dehydrogenase (E3) component
MRGTDVALTVEQSNGLETRTFDTLLVATGRRANVDSLNLEAAGVEVSARGVVVNDRCRTSRRHIYAAGDVTGEYRFTHMSEHTAKVAIANALLKVPARIDRKHVPWSTFTDPEVAHVGATEKHLNDRGVRFAVHRFPYSRVDRALTDSAADGFIRVYAKPSSGKILGADVVGARAGELISEYAVAMRNGVSLRKISDTIHPYPTYGLGARRAADQWYVQKQSPSVVRLLKALFGYRGLVLQFGPDDVL